MPVRRLMWSDMDDLIRNYYSYYDELALYPDLGLILFKQRPNYASEIDWFTALYKDAMNNEGVAMVAEEDGRAVGLCDIQMERKNSEISHVGVLGIAILKDYRGKGLGRALMTSALEEGKKLFDIIRLGVFVDNHAAISLYRKLGFVEYGRLPAALKRNGKYRDEILMYYDCRKTI
ncbi:MAG: GNAT family N-acetyltransferase [Methanomassiliicoccales archaeon]